MSRYRSSHAARATYPVIVLCRVLRVSRAGYYAWAGRGVSARARADADLAAQIAAAHARSRATYGVPRIHAALSRLMRAGGLVGCHRRRRARTTGVDPVQRPAPNLVARDFAAPAPNRLWLGDITYVPTGAG